MRTAHYRYRYRPTTRTACLPRLLCARTTAHTPLPCAHRTPSVWLLLLRSRRPHTPLPSHPYLQHHTAPTGLVVATRPHHYPDAHYALDIPRTTPTSTFVGCYVFTADAHPTLLPHRFDLYPGCTVCRLVLHYPTLPVYCQFYHPRSFGCGLFVTVYLRSG